MGRAIFLLGLTAMIGAPNLWGQRAVDVKRPEERAREQKVVERQEKKKAKSTDLEIRGATAFKENELRTALKEQIATIHDFGLTAARADDAAFFLELFYRKHGYAKVDVTIPDRERVPTCSPGYGRAAGNFERDQFRR